MTGLNIAGTISDFWEKIGGPQFFLNIEEYFENLLNINITEEFLLLTDVAAVGLIGIIGLCVLVYRKYF